MAGSRNRFGRWHALLAGKAAVAALAALVFLTTATGWVVVEWLDSRLRDVVALDPGSDAVIDAPGQLGDENFLLVGSDTRAGAQPEDDVGTAADIRGARADVIMVAHLPSDRSRVVIVSFPRDLEVARPPCEVWDATTGDYTGVIDPGAEVTKIAETYLVGGPKCITRVVQQLSGLAIHHFMGIDFQGFKAMVDAVGGVPICVEQPLEDRELGMILPSPGYSTISGDTALDLVRARMVVGDPTGDYGRIIRQQNFLAALLRKTLSADVLFSPGKLRAVTDAVAANTFGDNVGFATLLRLARSLQGLDAAEVTFVTVPTVGEANENGNEELRVDDTAALFRAIIDGTPLPGEAPAADAPASDAVGPSPHGSPHGVSRSAGTTEPQPLLAPSDVLVRVLNGSGIGGQAAAAARALRAVGFGVVEVGNARGPVSGTEIYYSVAREAQARTLAAAVPEATLTLDESRRGSVVLVVGPDFDATVTAVPTTQTPPPLPGDLAVVSGADSACG